MIKTIQSLLCYLDEYTGVFLMKKIMQLKEVIVWFTSTSKMFSVRVCVCVCVCVFVCVCARARAQLCLSLCDPLDYSLPGSSDRGIFPAKILE